MHPMWSFRAAEAFATALPFEHLARKRQPAEALARWRTEAAAYQDERAPCVALLLAAGGDTPLLRDTVATWALQTWPACMLVLAGGDPAQRADVESMYPGVRFAGPGVDAATLTAMGADWVVPAVAGDLLHPSLAGVVALAAESQPDCVAWDWLAAERQHREVRVVTRYRAPWRDPLAELERPARTRAYSVPATAWSGCPARSAWHVRMSLPADAVAVHHPEPLSIQLGGGPGSPACPEDIQRALEAHWQEAFERNARGWQPARAGTGAGVAAVILYRDRPEMTLAAIRSVVDQRIEGPLQLVLVDNQSAPETRAAVAGLVRSLPQDVLISAIEYDAPFNHSRQCNLAAAAAVHDVLVFVNNDVEFLDRDALRRMVRYARLAGVATVGARIVDSAGATRGGGFRARRMPGAEFNSPVEEAAGAYGEYTRLTVGNTFACAAVSKAAYEALGGLDELRFPVGYNDVDFCLRAAAAGWIHVNVAEARITHAVGASRARTDEVAQKLALRSAHPWLSVRALAEWDAEAPGIAPATLPDPWTDWKAG